MLVENLSTILLSCATLYMHPNQTNEFHGEGETPKVISNAFPILNEVKSPDCILVLTDPALLAPLTGLVVRSRSDIRVMVTTGNREMIYTFKDSQSSFPIYIPIVGKESVKEYVHISPQGDRSKKRKLTVCYTLFPPYVVNPMEPNPIGLDPELVRTLAKHFNIEVTFKNAKSFTELIMFLLFGQADMAISQPNLVHARYELGLDISPALTQRSFYFIVRHPVPVDSFYTVVYPFSPGVWAGTLASIIMVACTFAILNKAYGAHCVIGYRDISISYIPLVSESVPHAWYHRKIKNPYFIVLYIWLLLGFLLAQAYKSNLLANLVKVDYEKPPATFQDVLDRKMSIYITAGSVIILMMRDSPFEVHRRAFHEGVEERGGYFQSTVMPPDLIQEIIDGKVIGIAPQDSMAPYQHFARPGEDVLTTGYTGFYYPIKLPLQKELDKGLQALYEAGITEELRDQYEWFLAAHYREQKRTQDADPEIIIEMNHFLPMMFLLISGLALTSLVATFEIFAGRCRRRINRKKSISYFIVGSGKSENKIEAFKKR